MAKARVLQAVCTVAMLAAAPAFAQTNAKPADTGADNTPNVPAAHDTMTPAGQGSSMSPGMNMGSTHMTHSSGGMSTHRSAMMGHDGAMGGRGDSQNAAVDRLNDQSYQAAHSGQSFSGPSTGYGTGTTLGTGMGSMGNATGVARTGSGSAAGATDGSGAK